MTILRLLLMHPLLLIEHAASGLVGAQLKNTSLMKDLVSCVHISVKNLNLETLRCHLSKTFAAKVRAARAPRLFFPNRCGSTGHFLPWFYHGKLYLVV